jgi:O-succinylbenzoate synthase
MKRAEGEQGSGTLRSWSDLTSYCALVAAEVLMVELPFRTPVATSVGIHRNRPLVLVRLVGRCADGRLVEGWGECAALGDTIYDPEDVAGTFTFLECLALPTLVAAATADGALPPVASLGRRLLGSDRPLAFAALEMAVADAHLRCAGRSFPELLGVTDQRVAPGAVLGLPRSESELLADLESLHDAGYARVKIKIAPGLETVVARAVRPLVGSGLVLQLDANGSYGPDAAERLGALDDLGLACIEQPLGRDDLEGHRRLAAALVTPICLDESLDSPATVVEAVEGGACSVVCVKPARLGGIGAALEVITWCDAHVVPWWIGGMFESGYARGVNRALSALIGHSLPGDLAPSQVYLAADLVEPVRGTIDASSGLLSLPVPAGLGMGPGPDPTLIEPWLVRRVVLDVPGT